MALTGGDMAPVKEDLSGLGPLYEARKEKCINTVGPNTRQVKKKGVYTCNFVLVHMSRLELDISWRFPRDSIFDGNLNVCLKKRS